MVSTSVEQVDVAIATTTQGINTIEERTSTGLTAWIKGIVAQRALEWPSRKYHGFGSYQIFGRVKVHIIHPKHLMAGKMTLESTSMAHAHADMCPNAAEVGV
jgi:hypothetical protein